jgi:hypothetical protein
VRPDGRDVKDDVMRRICSAIVGLTLLAAPAAASDGRQTASAAAEAARALQQQAAQIAASGGRLDMTVAPASDNLRRILDVTSFDKLPPISAADMAWIIDWLVAVRTTNFTLLYFGADPRQPMRLSPEKLERNVNQYEDEIARVMVFSQKLFPRALATAQAFFETLPEKDRNSKVRLDGFARMMSGYLESVEGALGFAAPNGTKAANVRAIAAALHDSAPVWTEIAQPDLRKRFAGLVTVARGKTADKETVVHLRAIEAALGAAKS